MHPFFIFVFLLLLFLLAHPLEGSSMALGGQRSHFPHKITIRASLAGMLKRFTDSESELVNPGLVHEYTRCFASEHFFRIR